MGKRERALLLIMLVLAFLPQSFRVQAQGQTSIPVVRIDPAQTESRDINDNFTIHVWVDNAADVEAAQVQLTYDPTVLNATEVVEGPFLPSAGETIVAQAFAKEDLSSQPPMGTVNYSSAIITMGALASGSGILLNVTFRVVSEGSAQIHLIPFTAAGTWPGTYFLDIQSNNINASLVDGFYGSPVSLTANPAVITVGGSTTLSGRISGSSAANVTSVDLMYAPQGSNWIDLGTIPVNSSGYYSRQWTPSKDGVYEFQITFTLAGRTTNSTVLLMIVEPALGQGFGILLLYACVGLTAFIAALAVIMRVRRRGKQSDEPPPVA
jgi:hypothetical protein